MENRTREFLSTWSEVVTILVLRPLGLALGGCCRPWARSACMLASSWSAIRRKKNAMSGGSDRLVAMIVAAGVLASLGAGSIVPLASVVIALYLLGRYGN